MKYVLGLDIGITSIGWALIDKDSNRIVRPGVRIFEKAEHPKNGESLATPRREARTTRRRLERRRRRLDTIKSAFVKYNILTQQEIEKSLDSTAKINPYRARATALDHQITLAELFRSLYLIGKRRGYRSARIKVEESDKDSGAYLSAIKHNSQLRTQEGYRTVGEMIYKSDEFKDRKRNVTGSYTKTIQRSELMEEAMTILEKQKEYYPQITPEFINAVVGSDEEGDQWSLSYQMSFATGNDILKKVGKCGFEKEEFRAAKSTYSFELFRTFQSLNHLQLWNSEDGSERGLTEDERTLVIDFVHSHDKCTYTQLRKKLGLSDAVKFKGLPYGVRGKKKKNTDEESKPADPESKVFAELKAYNTWRKALKDTAWWGENMSERATLDTLGTIFTLYRTDKDIQQHLAAELPSFPLKEYSKIAAVSFSGFGHISVKAIDRILPYLEQGMLYSDACQAAGYDHRRHTKSGGALLPPIPTDDHSITNPVVRRALSQCIKLVNAVIREYGPLSEIHIECAREMGKSHRDRQDDIKDQEENRSNNEAVLEKLKENFNLRDPKPFDMVKYKLWEQQGCKCAYTLQQISPDMLFDKNQVEVDHIIPYSRCGNDGNANKVLVLTAANREKRNQTPYEWFGGDATRWADFAAYVEGTGMPYAKKARMLSHTAPTEGWNTRALNDTRYITRYLKNYIEDYLEFAADSDKKQRVIVVNGSTTAYLRKRWGLGKSREDSVRHHAQDAVVVAVVNPSLIQKVARYEKVGEISSYFRDHKTLSRGLVDPETGEVYDETMLEEAQSRVARHERGRDHFPKPWPGFREELEQRVFGEDAKVMQSALVDTVESYQNGDVNWVQPLFVSRMPVRKGTGEAHAATLRSPKGWAKSGVTIGRMNVSDLVEKDLPKLVCRHTDPKLYAVLEQRLKEHGNDPKKAWATPVYKPSRDQGRASEVRSVRIEEGTQSGYLINNGSAMVNNGDMVRVDVFTKEIKGKKKYFTVPVYVHQIGKGKKLPTEIIPTMAGQSHIDNTFDFCFSVYSRDLVLIAENLEDRKDISKYGYFVGYNRAGGGHKVVSHDAVGVNELKKFGVLNVAIFEKYTVDMLGGITRVQHETRV